MLVYIIPPPKFFPAHTVPLKSPVTVESVTFFIISCIFDYACLEMATIKSISSYFENTPKLFHLDGECA